MENSNKAVIGISVAIVLAGIGTGLFFIFKKPEETSTTTETSEIKDAPTNGNSGDSPSPTPTKPKDTRPMGGTPASLGVDYSGLSVSLKSPANSHGLSLGQSITVKNGTTVTRLDKYHNKVGTTKLTANTNLGTVFHFNPSSVIIKQNKNFSYPFYLVSYDSLYPQKFYSKNKDYE